MPDTPQTDIGHRDRRVQKLREHLNHLKLKAIDDALDSELNNFASSTEPVESLLLRLLDLEVTARTNRRIDRRVRLAHMPARKSLINFDFAFQPSLDSQLVLELASTRFVDRRESLVISGNSGTGKSHIAMAIGMAACQRGISVLYTTAASMLADLFAGLADDSLPQRLKKYTRPALLIIDELGFDRLEQESARNAALFFKVVDGRYETSSTLVTTNISFEALGHYLGDPVVTTAIVDRLVHRAIVINIDGPSYRLKQSKEYNAKIRQILPQAKNAEEANSESSVPQNKAQPSTGKATKSGRKIPSSAPKNAKGT